MFVGEGKCERCESDGVVLYAHYLPEAICANCIAELFEAFRLLLIEEEAASEAVTARGE